MNKILEEIIVKALGQTIEHKGEIILMVKEMPVNCMVLFVDMDTWHKIKGKVNILNE